MRSKTSNLRFLEDLTRVASGAITALGDIKSQIRQMVKERVDRVVGEMDMVSREEFEAIEAMAIKAREQQVELEQRLAALEGKTPVKTKTSKKSGTAKTTKTAKKTVSKKKPSPKKTPRKTTKKAGRK